MKAKKAQAAMEFLMTYGWAILVVLVALAALWYFGVLPPINSLEQQPVWNTKTVCFKYNIAGTLMSYGELVTQLQVQVIKWNQDYNTSYTSWDFYPGGVNATDDAVIVAMKPLGPKENITQKYRFPCVYKVDVSALENYQNQSNFKFGNVTG